MASAPTTATSWGYPARPPRTLFDFAAVFPDEESCRRYLAQVRWPHGFSCAACGGRGCWWKSDGRLRCASCKRDVSLTAGTIFADSHMPLLTWFRAAWLVTNTKNGMSAVSLQRALGLRRYETAWLMLHKLRRAMVRPGRGVLADEVEIDEAFVGGPTAGARGRGTARAIVAIAAECRSGGKIGRIRLEHIPDTTRQTLHDFCFRNIAHGTIVNTDGFSGYTGLAGYGYIHNAQSLSQHPSPAHVVMPRVHRVSSLLKRWLLGTHHGGLRTHQLEHYLDEFVFRFNRRSSRSRGALFLRLLQQGCQTDPVEGARIRGGHP